MKLLRKLLGVPSKAWNWLQLQRLKTSFAAPPLIRGRLFVGGRGELIVGKKVVINSSHRSNPVGGKARTSIHIAPTAKIAIGNNVGISNSLLYSRVSITIEDDVMIGGGCQIYDTDFHSIRYEDRILNGDKATKSAPVLIKKGAFVGTSSIILKGVTVGERSIVAAGSVVVKDVPNDEVWGGNPCSFIKKLS
jgi:acetyltransferase-like isoleucine patch superfamily enzyme